jgi:hypothetical protein
LDPILSMTAAIVKIPLISYRIETASVSVTDLQLSTTVETVYSQLLHLPTTSAKTSAGCVEVMALAALGATAFLIAGNLLTLAVSVEDQIHPAGNSLMFALTPHH